MLSLVFSALWGGEYRWETVADQGTGEEMDALLAGKENAYLIIWRNVESGDMLIHIAANAGNLPVIQSLIRHKAKIDAQDSEGRTALYVAASRHRTKVARFLLENGASAKIKTKTGGILFDWVQSNHDAYDNAETVDLFHLLIKYKAPGLNGGNGKQAPILGAASSGNPELVRAYIEAKAKIKVFDSNGASPIQLSFTQLCSSYRENSTECSGHEKHIGITEMLYEAGSRVMEGKNDVTLHYAARYGYVSLVRKILSGKTDVNRPDKDGMTPLMHAATARTERIAVVSALLAAGARKSPPQANPNSLIDLCEHLEAKEGCSAEVKKLLMD